MAKGGASMIETELSTVSGCSSLTPHVAPVQMPSKLADAWLTAETTVASLPLAMMMGKPDEAASGSWSASLQTYFREPQQHRSRQRL